MKQVMARGAHDPATKEIIYLAVSAANNCEYCTYSHTAGARRAGMTEEMLGELMAVVAMAAETNTLAHAFRIPVDERFMNPPRAQDARESAKYSSGVTSRLVSPRRNASPANISI